MNSTELSEEPPDASDEPAAGAGWEAAKGLVYLLLKKAGEDPQFLALLRQDKLPYAATVARKLAPTPKDEEVYLGVMRLFARSHLGVPMHLIGYGKGSMGAALARPTWRSHPRYLKASERHLAQLLQPRLRVPWRQLDRACTTIRAAGYVLPDFRRLTCDLLAWNEPAIVRGYSVTERWYRDFASAARNGPLHR